MSKNLTLIKNPDLSFLDYRTFLSILSHPYLRVTSEFELFEVVSHFIAHASDPLSQVEIDTLLNKIGFREMNTEQLAVCAPYLPNDMLIDALMYSLHQLEVSEGEYRPDKVSYNKRRVIYIERSHFCLFVYFVSVG